MGIRGIDILKGDNEGCRVYIDDITRSMGWKETMTMRGQNE